jgi:hypothetical protein
MHLLVNLHAFLVTYLVPLQSLCRCPMYTHSKIARMSHESDLGRGSGWTEEGMSLYNRIHHIVKEDRIKSGNNFNQELAQVGNCTSKRSEKT